MIDNELLQRAARAAGLRYIEPTADYSGRLGLALCDEHGRWTEDWNPLYDDGDALRLACALRMRVEPWGSGASAVVSIDNRSLVAEPHYGDDPERATRRAIVRAAAALAEPPK